MTGQPISHRAPTPSARRRQGFTLIELLTVLAVLSVVTTLGVTAFVELTSYWNLTELRLDLTRQSERIIDRMQEDFENVLSTKLAGVAIQGVSAMEEEQRYKQVRLEDDRVTLPVQFRDPRTDELHRISVTYAIDRRGGVAQLVRRTSATLGEEGAVEQAGVVADGVLALRIQYLTGPKWVDAWDRDRQPDAVAVNFVLQDPDRPWEQVSRRAVYPIHVD